MDQAACKHKNERSRPSPEPDICEAGECVDCGLQWIRMHPYMPWNQEGRDQRSQSSERGKRNARQRAAYRASLGR